jgi:hypothetical protein
LILCIALFVAMFIALRYLSEVWFAWLGVIGVGILFVAVRIDLEKDVPGSGSSAIILERVARQLDGASRRERAERRSENIKLQGTLWIAKLVGFALAVFGFGDLVLARFSGNGQ